MIMTMMMMMMMMMIISIRAPQKTAMVSWPPLFNITIITITITIIIIIIIIVIIIIITPAITTANFFWSLAKIGSCSLGYLLAI